MKLIQNEKKILNDFYTVENLINDLQVLNEFYQKKEISEQEINNHYNKTLDKLLGQRMITPLRGKYA